MLPHVSTRKDCGIRICAVALVSCLTSTCRHALFVPCLPGSARLAAEIFGAMLLSCPSEPSYAPELSEATSIIGPPTAA